MEPHRSSQKRKARVCAFQMLYQWETAKETPEHVKESFWGVVGAEAPRDYANKLFDAAASQAVEVDEIIARHVRGWSVKRLAAVDRSLLRLAITEFRHFPEIPPAIVINEILDIAKMFSGEGSSEFLNGVLDSVLKSEKTKA